MDIETTGLSSVFDKITIVGLYDGKTYRAFVEGHDLDEFPEHLSKYSIVVTFNGSLFDLRFVRNAFPHAFIPPIHIDLRFVAKKLRVSGGLKAVEQAFGIRRSDTVARLNGFDAVVLWSKYMRGDRKALDLLIQYNMEDVIHLKPLLETAYDRLVRQTAPFFSSDLPPTNGRVPYEATQPLKTKVGARTSPRRFRGPQIVPALLAKLGSSGRAIRVVGIDLTGSKKRASGWALLEGQQAKTKLLRTDEQIISDTLAVKPDLVSIDSPLSLPGGTQGQLTGRKGTRIYRGCELALRRMGISVFWCLLPSMRLLTFRGIRLAKKLRAHGIKVIESYPGAAQDILLIPRKKTSLEELKWGLVRAGIEGDFLHARVSHDELDAMTSALVGLFYQAGEYVPLGNAEEDYLIVPKSPQMNVARLTQVLSTVRLDKPQNL